MRKVSHWPAGPLVGLAVLVFIGAFGRCLLGCVLTPAAKAGIEAAAAVLCPFEAAIPIAGPALVAACPGEELALAAALAAVPTPPPTPPVVAPVRLYRVAKAGERVSLRVGPLDLVHVGYAPPGPHARAVQAVLLMPAKPHPTLPVAPMIDGGSVDAKPHPETMAGPLDASAEAGL